GRTGYWRRRAAHKLALFEADNRPDAWNGRANACDAAQLLCSLGIKIDGFVAGVGCGVESDITPVVQGDVCPRGGRGNEAEVSASWRWIPYGHHEGGAGAVAQIHVANAGRRGIISDDRHLPVVIDPKGGRSDHAGRLWNQPGSAR